MYRVTILCSDAQHPVMQSLEHWVDGNRGRAETRIIRRAEEVEDGDFLFLVSCHQIVKPDVLDRFRFALVLHASELPKGRGMSPHIWAILSGSNEVVLSLLSAAEALDSGPIWQQRRLSFDGTELYNEINDKLFAAELELMNWALDNCDSTTAREQVGEPSFLRKRNPADSEIDPNQSIAQVFDLLRVADPDRYPAFFTLRGQAYRIRLEKV